MIRILEVEALSEILIKSPSSGGFHRDCRKAHCYDGDVNIYADYMVNAHEQVLRTVFLDRDGVLNEKMPEGCYVTRWEEFQMLAGVPAAIARLNSAGLRVIVVSNQRGVARGLYTLADVEAIHAAFQRELQSRGAQVDAFYFCPHDKRSCICRKPLPGMFEQAMAQFPQIEATSSVMIGDSLSDMEFGRRLGMKTIFIEVSPERQRPGAETARTLADLCCHSLSDAVEALLG
jgi:D-glycero-D-manno-heptose 1,7-bisphosphate phosphatase